MTEHCRRRINKAGEVVSSLRRRRQDLCWRVFGRISVGGCWRLNQREVVCVNISAMNEVPQIVKTFFDAWILRDPSIAAAMVTNDVTVKDPNNNVRGPEALVEHLELALRHFDFSVEYGQCWGEPNDFVFLCHIALSGRSKHYANVQINFAPAVFVKLTDGLISSWAEYWDPRALNASLSVSSQLPGQT